MVECKRLDEIRIVARIVESNEKLLSEGKESRFESVTVSTRRGTMVVRHGPIGTNRDRDTGGSAVAFLAHSSGIPRARPITSS